jgi:membrane-associated protease RseP (regulator of RpoE activity)
LGLYGSKSAADKLLNADGCYNYMLNFDMVGRLDSSRQLIVNGFGTSGAWSKLETLATAQQFKLKTFESGIGPSDHTSFYLREIPVLHFFTGSHSDYHKPSDVAEKVNAAGIADIELLVRSLIADLDDEEPIDYIKTKEENNEDAPRFSVTLGVIPDYAFEGRGMRIDGVSDGKPAANAGIIAGDIIINLGGYDVADMMGYMKALSKFKAGDATTVTIMRKDETIEKPIQF